MPDYQSGGFGGLIDWGTNEVEGHTGLGVATYDNSGDATILDGGTANQYLRVNSAGNALEFGGSADWTELADETLGADATSFNVSVDTTGYAVLKVLFINALNDTATREIWLRINNSSLSLYSYAILENGTYGSSASNTKFNFGNIYASNETLYEFTISNLGTNPLLVKWEGGSTQRLTSGVGEWTSASAITSLDFISSSDKITAGTRVIVLGRAT